MSNIIKVNFNPTWRQNLDELINRQIQDRVFPGMELLFATHGDVYLHQAWGKLEIGEDAAKLQTETVFDIASMTKPMATATAIMILQEQGLLNLEDCVVEFIPEFKHEEKQKITIRHLLTHSSGLPAWANLFESISNKNDAWTQLMQVPLIHPVNSKMVYSCLGFLILGEIIRRLARQSLAQFTRSKIFEPLQMNSTCFSPLEHIPENQIAPTEYCPYRKKLLRGVVHDENCYVFDEEGGNAGLFSKAQEIYRFCQMIFNGGELDGARILSPQSVRIMTRNHNPDTLAPRGLGWDISGEGWGYMSCGELFPRGSIGHTGFTGTSFWLHLPSRTAVIALTNRVHISREKKLAEMHRFRPRLHNILMASIEPRNAESTENS
ncbi:MAG: beta-lactamase family protein [SAR324 cluster bacterium]|nr:beta-lactamase family protein [SAR324 cluster bacterium]